MVSEMPRSWDNVSNNHWVIRDMSTHWGWGFLNFILIILVILLTFMMFSMIFFFIALPFALVYYWFSSSDGLFNFILISITVIPSLIATGYTIYSLLRVKNTGGTWYHSSMKTSKISRKGMLKQVYGFLEENGYRYRSKYYWLLGTRWYIFDIRKQRIKFKVVIDKGFGKKTFNFHIGPILKLTELEANEMKKRFSKWAAENIRPKIGEFPIYKQDHIPEEVKQ
jgi:hypothetical protein